MRRPILRVYDPVLYHSRDPDHERIEPEEDRISLAGQNPDGWKDEPSEDDTYDRQEAEDVIDGHEHREVRKTESLGFYQFVLGPCNSFGKYLCHPKLRYLSR